MPARRRTRPGHLRRQNAVVDVTRGGGLAAAAPLRRPLGRQPIVDRWIHVSVVEPRDLPDRERILWALDDVRTDALAELRGVLLQEHEWRAREGLV